MKYEEVSIVSHAGKKEISITLSVWENAEESDTVVFLSGTMSYPFIYNNFLNGICENGFNVVGVHFVSHGKSEKVKEYTLSDMLINTRDAVDYAVKRWKRKVCIMGSSQGGILASIFAGKDERVKCVFPHNIADTNMNESMSIVRLPKWLYVFMKPAKFILSIFAKIFPTFKVRLSHYLDVKKIFSYNNKSEYILDDPLLIKYYPLCFISSLFNADTTMLFDGSIKCPLVLITSTGDPLFSYEYTKKVFDKIKAGKKEMIVLDVRSHLIFSDHTDLALSMIVPKLKEYMM